MPMMTIEIKAQSQAKHDAIRSGIHVSPDFEDGALLDLLAYEQEAFVQAEAEIRQLYRGCADGGDA